MKNSWFVIRLFLALAGIFTCGVITGRLTAPSEANPDPHPQITITAPDQSHVSQGVNRAVRRYQQALDLTPEQMQVLLPEFQKMAQRVVYLPKQSQARQVLLEEFHARMEKILTPEQKVKSQKLLQQARDARR